MDDQKLKEMLSAWFDGELSREESAQVEAYLERSAEAREIVARYKALKQLTDKSALNPKSDYWERSAAKIESVLGEQSVTKVTPVKKSGWSNWGVKAVSLAASLALLAYVGFHSEEILKRMHDREEPQSEKNMIQEKGEEDQSLDRFGSEGDSHEEAVDMKADTTIRTKEPLPEPLPPTATETQRVEPTSLIESADEVKLQQERQKKPTTATGKDEGKVKTETVPSESETNERTVASPQLLGEQSKVKTRTDNQTALAPAPGKSKGRTDISLSSEPEEATEDSGLGLPERLKTDLEESLDTVLFYDSTSADATYEEQMRYIWNHDIKDHFEARKAVEPLIYDFDAGSPLVNSLRDSKKDSKKSEKGEAKSEKLSKRQLGANQRKIIDAAFYVGSTTDKDGEYSRALDFLEFMAFKNDRCIVKDYARDKYNALKDL